MAALPGLQQVTGDRSPQLRGIFPKGIAVPIWIVNFPESFQDGSLGIGKLVDTRDKEDVMNSLINYVDEASFDSNTDGESIDILEHFFWGMSNGIAMELGSSEGSPKTMSMTYGLEKYLNWRRILIEGNPSYKEELQINAPTAFSAITAICKRHTKVHYSTKENGGVIEFMDTKFLKKFHPDIYNAGVPLGNISSIEWNQISQSNQISLMDCIPLAHILRAAKTTHVNVFLLDVEGAELDVLESINWEVSTFDVICVETDSDHRPQNYGEDVMSFLATKGYKNVTSQIGGNTWFINNNFIPISRPGVCSTCYNGVNRAHHGLKSFSTALPPSYYIHTAIIYHMFVFFDWLANHVIIIIFLIIIICAGVVRFTNLFKKRREK